MRSCFAAGTPLLTPEGSKPIEQFRPGDWVLAAPEDDPEAPPEPRLVEEVFHNYAPLMDLVVGGRTIRTTAEHPFWVRGRGWTAAHQLMAGDHLKSHTGRWVALDGVVGNLEAAPVYNMRVADYHTYFVGGVAWGFSIWVHNAPGGYGSGISDQGNPNAQRGTLPRSTNGDYLPDPTATGPHSVLGERVRPTGPEPPYRQGA